MEPTMTMTNYDLRWAELEERRLHIATELESLDWRAQRRERDRCQIGVFYRNKLQASLRRLHQRKAETRRIQQALMQRIDENLSMTPARRDRSMDELKKRYGSLVESMKKSWLEQSSARAIDRLADVERSLQQSVAIHEYEQDLATREQQIKDRIVEQRQRVRSIQDQLLQARYRHDDELFAKRIDEQRQESEARAKALEEAVERDRQRELSRLQLARDNEQRLKSAVALEMKKDRQVTEIEAQRVLSTTSAHLYESDLEQRLGTALLHSHGSDQVTAEQSCAQSKVEVQGSSNLVVQRGTQKVETDTESKGSMDLGILVNQEMESDGGQLLPEPNLIHQTTMSPDPAAVPTTASALISMPTIQLTESRSEQVAPSPNFPNHAHKRETFPNILTKHRQTRKVSQIEPALAAYALVPKPKPKPSNRTELSLIGLVSDPMASSEEEASENRHIVLDTPHPNPEAPEHSRTAPTPSKMVVRPKLKLSSLISGEETDSDDISLELNAKPMDKAPAALGPVFQSSSKPDVGEFDF